MGGKYIKRLKQPKKHFIDGSFECEDQNISYKISDSGASYSYQKIRGENYMSRYINFFASDMTPLGTYSIYGTESEMMNISSMKAYEYYKEYCANKNNQ